MNGEGYKEFVKAVTKMSQEDLESVFNRESVPTQDEILADEFEQWWRTNGQLLTSHCATIDEADQIRIAAERAYLDGYRSGFSAGKFGP